MEEQETGDKYTIRSFMIVKPWGDLIKEDDLEGWWGGAYGVHVE
jgi:hypothetical protein